MSDLRQIAAPITTVILAGAMVIFGQMYLDHRAHAQIGRPAIAVALPQQ
jgi:hypothetical protein